MKREDIIKLRVEALCEKLYNGAYKTDLLFDMTECCDDDVLVAVYYDYIKSLDKDRAFYELRAMSKKRDSLYREVLDDFGLLFEYIQECVPPKRIKKFFEEKIRSEGVADIYAGIGETPREFDIENKIKFFYIMKTIAKHFVVLRGCKKKTSVEIMAQDSPDVLLPRDSKQIEKGYYGEDIGNTVGLIIEKLSEIMSDPEAIKTYIEGLVEEIKNLHKDQGVDFSKLLDEIRG